MKYLLLLLLVSCTSQRDLRKQYRRLELNFNNSFVHSIWLRMKYDQTRDSTFLYQSDTAAKNAVKAYNEQVKVNKKLKKPYPVYGIADKAYILKHNLQDALR